MSDLSNLRFRVHGKMLRLSPKGLAAASRFKASTGHEVDFDALLGPLRRAPPGRMPVGYAMAFEEAPRLNGVRVVFEPKAMGGLTRGHQRWPAYSVEPIRVRTCRGRRR
jgi:hypothetical protein